MTKRRKPLGLNAVGKPYGANYNPNRKKIFGLTKISRLRAPHGPGMFSTKDRPSRPPAPAPLLDRLERQREEPR